ncbi:MAG: ankyrin repeat domain-containing protein [Rickettsiales bacterium]|nr:ankyrin repeat domain-containing protein [Rickettsiales bacterium]
MKRIKRKGKRVNHKTKTKRFKEHLIETPDEDGMYPIHIAIQNNDLGTLEDLVDKGININKYNRNKDTPLLLAIKENNLQIVGRLLEEGADLNKSDASQSSPIDVAMNLEYQECVDLLMEYGTSQGKAVNVGVKCLDDQLVEFINSLIELLDNKIVCNPDQNIAQTVSQDIMILSKQYLDLRNLSSSVSKKLHQDINQKIFQFITTLKNNVPVTKKDILNLVRKVIVLIQEYKKYFSTAVVWNLNRIESLVEERIVDSNVESEKLAAYVFTPKNISNKQDGQIVEEIKEDWYSQNGYRDFDEFVKVNNLGAGSIEFLKFSVIERENILQRTCNFETENFELITIKPTHLADKKVFMLLISDALKRIQEEQKLLEYDFDNWKRFDELLHKIHKGAEFSLDENIKLDKFLRPGKREKMHIVHFHHTDGYEPFWHDFTKEAFLTGATIHLFNHIFPSPEKADLIYSGIAVVNNILDQDIHPDKIILQGYGNGYLVSKEVRNQFQKRGIDLMHINYQHSLFPQMIYPECICNHRELNIYFDDIHNIKTPIKKDTPDDFMKLAEYVVSNLKQSTQNIRSPYLTDANSKNYSLAQLVNVFIATTQDFLKKNTCHKNPLLPQERVENILGVINA